MNDWIKYYDGNRVPSQYPKASTWYSDDDRERASSTADFLNALRGRVRSPYNKTGKVSDIRGMELSNLKFATKDDEKRLEEYRNAEIDGANWGLNADTTNYVPIVYTEGKDSPVKHAYLVRHKRSGGDDTIFGMELSDGRSLTAKGAEKFLNGLKSKGGGAAIEVSGNSTVSDLSKANFPNMEAKRKGFLEALHSVAYGNNYLSTGEVGAFPSNWWGQ